MTVIDYSYSEYIWENMVEGITRKIVRYSGKYAACKEAAANFLTKYDRNTSGVMTITRLGDDKYEYTLFRDYPNDTE